MSSESTSARNADSPSCARNTASTSYTLRKARLKCSIRVGPLPWEGLYRVTSHGIKQAFALGWSWGLSPQSAPDSSPLLLSTLSGISPSLSTKSQTSFYCCFRLMWGMRHWQSGYKTSIVIRSTCDLTFKQALMQRAIGALGVLGKRQSSGPLRQPSYRRPTGQ
ncbi:uncharacterized protein K460DRAFT_88595 [Cucurbitaria berberidis CBS 394.84]|uniref:Uncharacterized protein n=1 Tax=Cucurbitaria berberidis CBS 394.84 TaxID=1168544 RepID=A0A9P4GMS7_9PLEO|nr:uncharacterized protein K460DRAFT_88595 [Cucurbitaria berberidis CBS 394.84]KAF1849303.1 hypothetical protein K460DRAFT_88595 [Cucurbitaria berberidis CBS 394.84]